MLDFGRQLIKQFKIGRFPGANFEIPLVFVDTCKLDPRQPVCFLMARPSEVY